MKAMAEIDTEASVATVSVTFKTMAEAGLAVDAVKNAALVLFPDIVFYDELSPTARIEAAKPPQPDAHYQAGFGKPPTPGQNAFDVLKAARDLGKVDAQAIADDLNMTPLVVNQMLGKLRKGGHLEGLA